MDKMPHKKPAEPKHGAPVGTKMTNKTMPVYSKKTKSTKGYVD